MGSWNDSPPYYAHKKGLEIEYDNDLIYFIEKNSKGRNIKEETYERKKSH